MAKERSIAKRLSGEEALDSMMHRVYERLRQHGHFHSHKAYQGYRARVTVEFIPAMSFSPPLSDSCVIDEMEADAEPGVPMREVVELPPEPPNKIREACGMDLPVQVEENGVLVERWVKPAKYKGKVRSKPKASERSAPLVPANNPVSEIAEEYGVQRRAT